MSARPSEILRAARVLNALQDSREAVQAATGRPRDPRRPRGAAARSLSSRFAAGLLLAWGGSPEIRPEHETEPGAISEALEACALALDHGATEDEALAALLLPGHRLDPPAPSLEAVRHLLGYAVAEILDGLDDPYREADLPIGLRQSLYLEHLTTVSASTRFVLTIHKLRAARRFLDEVRRDRIAAWCRLELPVNTFFEYFATLLQSFTACERTSALTALSATLNTLHDDARHLGIVRVPEAEAGNPVSP